MRPIAALNRKYTRLCSLVTEKLMVTIVVKLITSLATWSLRWVFAACCGHAPGVLRAPPSTKSDGRGLFSRTHVLMQEGA